MVVARSLSKRIRDVRDAAGLSQEQFARKAKLDRLTILRAENGHGGRDIQTLKKLAIVLGTSVDELSSLPRGSRSGKSRSGRAP